MAKRIRKRLCERKFYVLLDTIEDKARIFTTLSDVCNLLGIDRSTPFRYFTNGQPYECERFNLYLVDGMDINLDRSIRGKRSDNLRR